MAVKDRVGRTRYVAFRIEGGPLSRAAVGGALPEGAKLTRFDGTHGIARTPHVGRDALVAHLRGLAAVGGRPVQVVPLVTSGTLRKAAEALPADAPARRRTPR